MATRAPAWSIADMMRSAEEHINAGRTAEALALYEQILESEPNNAQILCAVGVLSVHFDQPERGAELLRRAIARNRNVADYHVQLSAALLTLERLDEAEAAARGALKLQPRNADALCNMGVALIKKTDFAAALTYLRKAVAIQPQLVIAHQNIGTALYRQGRVNDALDSYRTAVACDPTFPAAYAGLVTCLNLLPDVDPILIAEATCRGVQLLKRAPSRQSWTTSPEPDRKLRIGYVSGDFRLHPIAYFLENVLRAHDRNRIEVFCYCNNPNDKNDEVTERLRCLADVWRQIDMLDDDAAAALIRSDEIDIMVDLSGHTEGERLKLFMAKPAPIQCTWLGYYATTGFPEIDYIIADRFVVPPGDERLYVESPWRLPDSYLCFTPPDLSIPVEALPAGRNGAVTFGSFNNVLKVNKRVVAVWSRLLHAVPGSRLVLRSFALDVPEVRSELARQFAEHGIAGERLALLNSAKRAELLASYNSVDIALDPFPYGGGTTTVEALWMGVPVVTLRGDRFTGRVSESILTTVGLPELATSDEPAYIAKAAELARDLTHLADLRAGLRGKLVNSPLCDAPRFARNLEAAYRGMWRGWCSAKENAA